MHHKFFGEVLPYLEVQKQETEEDIVENIEMPDVTGMSVSEAKKTLKEVGLEVDIGNQPEENYEQENSEKTVIDQLPKKGIQINSNATVTIYVE